MAKTPLTERMEKAKAPKTWIREVKTKDNRIERLLEIKETYLNIIDTLAREKEQLEEENETLREFKRQVYEAYTPNSHCDIIKLAAVLGAADEAK